MKKWQKMVYNERMKEIKELKKEKEKKEMKECRKHGKMKWWRDCGRSWLQKMRNEIRMKKRIRDERMGKRMRMENEEIMEESV